MPQNEMHVYVSVSVEAVICWFMVLRGELYYSSSEPRLAKYGEERELGCYRRRNLMTHGFWKQFRFLWKQNISVLF